MPDLKNEILHETEEKLRLWGKWAAINGHYIGYPNATPFRRLRGGQVSAATIQDSEAFEIDKAVSEMGQIDELGQKVLVGYYINGLTLKQIADVLNNNISETKIKIARKSALMFIMGRIYNCFT